MQGGWIVFVIFIAGLIILPLWRSRHEIIYHVRFRVVRLLSQPAQKVPIFAILIGFSIGTILLLTLPSRPNVKTGPSWIIEPYPTDVPKPIKTPARLALIMLTENTKMEAALEVISQLDAKYNRHHNHTWVLFNSEPFTVMFKERVINVTKGHALFSLVKGDAWGITSKDPETINKWAQEGDHNVQRQSIHRWYTGFMWRDPILNDFDWIWRVEEGVTYHCDMFHMDPLRIAVDGRYKFGGSIMEKVSLSSTPSLWPKVLAFIKKYPHHIINPSAPSIILDQGSNPDSLCQLHNTFMLADLSFFRSPAYMDFFQFMDDESSGFLAEGWRDATIHSIAALMFLHPSQIRVYEELGYRDGEFDYCPTNEKVRKKYRCACDISRQYYDEAGGGRHNECRQKFHRYLSIGENGLTTTESTDRITHHIAMAANAKGCLQKRLAMDILQAGRAKVWLNPHKMDVISSTKTREGIRKLIDEGDIKRTWSEKEKSPLWYDMIYSRRSMKDYLRINWDADRSKYIPPKKKLNQLDTTTTPSQ
ncbi:hypothetical protein PROFUN_04076 [Planoprotostelium fungivorum]|uniref:Large ribosomal subunit protein eL19 domain-containing protein n=1 Tax=Planoprotostelium fungivorum TaxID=1890364 RepID=A0A2P6NJE8_9EUKA|nr:hypothetical protein PROFUN_04076 [Planoprotostelium fungivorum]